MLSKHRNNLVNTFFQYRVLCSFYIKHLLISENIFLTQCPASYSCLFIASRRSCVEHTLKFKNFWIKDKFKRFYISKSGVRLSYKPKITCSGSYEKDFLLPRCDVSLFGLEQHQHVFGSYFLKLVQEVLSKRYMTVWL